MLNRRGMSALVSSLLGEFAFEGVIFVVALVIQGGVALLLARLEQARRKVPA